MSIPTDRARLPGWIENRQTQVDRLMVEIAAAPTPRRRAALESLLAKRTEELEEAKMELAQGSLGLKGQA